MQEIYILLRDIQSIRDFVKTVITLELDYEVDLVQGKYVVDAKSIMGIFALDTLTPVKLVANTNDASKLFKAIEKYTVK